MSSKNTSTTANPIPKTDESRFAKFTDDEICMLSSQAAESSGAIRANAHLKYSLEMQEIHSSLMDELIIERIRRGL